MHQFTEDFYAMSKLLIHTLDGNGASLSLSMNLETVKTR